MLQKQKPRLAPFFCLLAAQAFSYLLYHSLAGGTLLVHSAYDSYALLADCWLNGTFHLPNGENFAWLELAIYQGKYYISFPPVPALVMLPLTVWLGWQAVPSHLVVAAYGLLSTAGVYALCARRGKSEAHCLLWSVLCVCGSNLYWMTTNGGVWFQAQSLCFVLCVWGLFAAAGGNTAWHTLAAFLMALAVGCRPFSILLLALFMAWLLRRTMTPDRHGHRSLAGFLLPFTAAALVGAALAAYNFARFGSPLEFGHTYLPEFQRLENGQFSPVYLWENLKNLFRPVLFTKELDLEFSHFNGFLFFAANPVFALWAARLAVRTVRGRSRLSDAAALAGFALGFVALCLHSTLGGWQFGARYTVDLIPFVLWSEAFSASQEDPAPSAAAWLLCALAVLFNLYGAVYMLSH